MDALFLNVKDDDMNTFRIFLVPALCLCLILGTAGCTVHNHYHSQAKAPPIDVDDPGRLVLEQRLESIHAAIEIRAHNLANVDTLAFKSKKVVFVEQQAKPQISINWTQGAPIETDSDLDLYINGVGFFQIEISEETGGGLAYTRAGNLFLNRDGELVLGNASGPRLAGGITVPEDCVRLNIASDGRVVGVLADQSEAEIGQIEVHRFLSVDGLESIGDNCFVATHSSGHVISGLPGEGGFGTIMQRSVEGSNVSLIHERIELIRLTLWRNAIAEQLGQPKIDIAAITIVGEADSGADYKISRKSASSAGE